MKRFTKYQREEILARMDTREESFEDDPESASGIECDIAAFGAMRTKVKTGVMEFTQAEREWLVGEFENMEDIGWSNMNSEGPEKVLGHINSMRNAANKAGS